MKDASVEDTVQSGAKLSLSVNNCNLADNEPGPLPWHGCRMYYWFCILAPTDQTSSQPCPPVPRPASNHPASLSFAWEARVPYGDFDALCREFIDTYRRAANYAHDSENKQLKQREAAANEGAR
jgi:hypothetical protein